MQDFILRKALMESWTPKQIWDYVQCLSEEEAGKLLLADKDDKQPRYELPSLRTVERTVSDFTAVDTSGAWRPIEAVTDPDDVRAVLDVLRAVILCTQGRKLGLSNQEADKVAMISRAMPGADPWLIWQVAKLYLVLEGKGDDTAPLDIFLAFKPWQDDCLDPYIDAVLAGTIPQAPLMFWLLGGPGWAKVAELADLADTGVAINDIETVTGKSSEVLERFVANRDSYVEALQKMDAARRRIDEETETRFAVAKTLLEEERDVIADMKKVLKWLDEAILKGEDTGKLRESYRSLDKRYKWLKSEYDREHSRLMQGGESCEVT